LFDGRLRLQRCGLTSDIAGTAPSFTHHLIHVRAVTDLMAAMQMEKMMRTISEETASEMARFSSCCSR
jgi:hypothetical protein